MFRKTIYSKIFILSAIPVTGILFYIAKQANLDGGGISVILGLFIAFVATFGLTFAIRFFTKD